MFCIISIFIVFIAYAEFPEAYEKTTTIKCCIIDVLLTLFKKKDNRFLSENKHDIYSEVQNMTKAVCRGESVKNICTQRK